MPAVRRQRRGGPLVPDTSQIVTLAGMRSLLAGLAPFSNLSAKQNRAGASARRLSREDI
jgi:hypothetical protein